MKQLACIAILVCLFTGAKAQIDSLQTRDTLKEKLQVSAIAKEIFILTNRKQDSLLKSSLYYHPVYQNSYWQYRVPATNSSTAKNVAEVVGNILLSVIADKNNRSVIH